MNTLVIIPARAGSKGLPGKNIKHLNGKPLIQYTIEIARNLFDDKDICVSTNDIQTVDVVKALGLNVPFLRPENLSTDTSTTRDVVLHALDYYQKNGVLYDQVLLLQPTSPFRTVDHIKEIVLLKEQANDVEMVVSVQESKMNPYFNLFEEGNGYLIKSKSGHFTRRQDCPKVYSYNGSVYLFDSNSIREKQFHEFIKIKKFVMSDAIYNVDIDTDLDWIIAEHIIDTL